MFSLKMQKHFSPGVQFKEVQSKFVSDKDISVDFLKLYKLYLSQTKARSTNYTWVQNDCSVRLPRIGLNPCGRHGLILVLHSRKNQYWKIPLKSSMVNI